MKSNDQQALGALKRPRHTLLVITGVLFGSCLNTCAFAQAPELNAPLVWTRGTPEIDVPPLTTASSPSQTVVAVSPPSINTRFDRIINTVAHEFQLDARLLHAIILVESRYKPDVESAKGAIGLMQVLPATAERFGYTDLRNVQNNVRAGASYLKWLLNHFDQNLELVLAAYNAGEGAVKKYGRQIPPYPETHDYVTKVMVHYREYAMAYPDNKLANTLGRRMTITQLISTLPTAARLNTLAALLLCSREHNEC